MITSKDLQNQLEINQSILDDKVDEWLKKKVLPFFNHNGLVVDIPSHIKSDDLVNTLERRGICASVHDTLAIVNISLPPKEK